MTGRGFMALGFGLVGVGLLIGVAIGRGRAPGPEQTAAPAAAPRPPQEGVSPRPFERAWNFGGQQLTDTTPAAAPALQVPPPNVGKLPARPAQVGLPDAGVRLDGSPPLPEAGVMPFDAGIPLPDASLPPQPERQLAAPSDAGAPPAPPENLVREGRVFNDSNITSSSFDDEDVSEYSVVPDRVVVPDRQVTRSSFDQEDRENEHPTGP